LRLISWNTNARRRVELQARALLARLPDLVALQEVTAASADPWAEALRAGGLQHLRATVSESSARRGPHAYCVLVASRHLFLHATAVSFPILGWDERVLSVVVDAPTGELVLHNVHVPNGSANGWARVEVLESVRAGVSAHCQDPYTLLCGDCNTPQGELPSG
jgi:exonuclease III